VLGQGVSAPLEGDDERESARRLLLAAELPAALAASAIAVHYQPIIRLDRGGGTSAEALARWAHPRHGVISPSEFLPLAEEYGLGITLFHYVLTRALAQSREWKRAGLVCAVAVNVSPSTLVDASVVGLITDALKAADMSADTLSLEITEHAFADDLPELLDSLARLRALGVGLAIDDFGTGSSSLASLERLPIQAIKLDRVFAGQLGDDGANEAFVSLVIQLAHQLNLTVVAQGVETSEALVALRRHGCDAAQGDWVCGPSPAATVTRFLSGQGAPSEGSRGGHLL